MEPNISTLYQLTDMSLLRNKYFLPLRKEMLACHTSPDLFLL